MKREWGREWYWQMRSEHKCLPMLMEWGCDSHSALTLQEQSLPAEWGSPGNLHHSNRGAWDHWLQAVAEAFLWQLSLTGPSHGSEANKWSDSHSKLSLTLGFEFSSLDSCRFKTMCGTALERRGGWRKITGVRRGASSLSLLRPSLRAHSEHPQQRSLWSAPPLAPCSISYFGLLCSTLCCRMLDSLLLGQEVEKKGRSSGLSGMKSNTKSVRCSVVQQ